MNEVNDQKNDEFSKRLMIFKLANEVYGIKLSFIREVVANQGKITPVPNSPSYFLGILNLRGDLISIIDLKKRFNIQSEPASHTVIIITEVEGEKFGFLVDDILRVTSVEEMQNAQFSDSERSEIKTLFSNFIESVCQLKDYMILVLKINVFLKEEHAKLSKEFGKGVT